MTIDLRYGDAIEQMKLIPDESIDAVISDIPYGISFSDWDIKHSNTNSALLGKFKVLYNDGRYSENMCYKVAKDYASIFGGKVIDAF